MPSLKRTAATATSRFHDSRKHDYAWPATKKLLPIANRPRDFTGVKRMRRNRNAPIVTPITRVEMLTSSCLTAKHLITRLRISSFGMPTRPCHATAVTRKMSSFATPPGAASIVTRQTIRIRGVLGKRATIVMARSHVRRTKAFDHDKTGFPLQGAHRDVACAACHVGERYKGISTACVACHRIQDVHGGRYGAKCGTCHEQNKWTAIRFNHDKDTKFPLRAAHAKVKCDTCHSGDLYRDKLATACVSCHRKDDPHKGQLGGRCAQC